MHSFRAAQPPPRPSHTSGGRVQMDDEHAGAIRVGGTPGLSLDSAETLIDDLLAARGKRPDADWTFEDEARVLRAVLEQAVGEVHGMRKFLRRQLREDCVP